MSGCLLQESNLFSYMTESRDFKDKRVGKSLNIHTSVTLCE